MYVRMYVCMYYVVCTYISIYVCVYVCIYVCTYVRTYACTYILSIPLSIHPFVRPSTYLSIFVSIYLSVCPSFYLPICQSVYPCNTERQLPPLQSQQLHTPIGTAVRSTRHFSSNGERSNRNSSMHSRVVYRCRLSQVPKHLRQPAVLYPDNGGSSKTSVPLCQTIRCQTQNATRTDASPRSIPLPSYSARNSTKCHFILRSAAFRSEICCAPESNFKS